MTVEQGLRAEFHERPKELARALRAAREQRTLGNEFYSWNMMSTFCWRKSKERYDYWNAVILKDQNPDQFLPKEYEDAEDEEMKTNLFIHLQEEHDLTLIESELDEIRRIVKNELRHTCQSDVSRRAVEPLVEAIFIIATAPHPANDLDYNSFIETTKRIAQKALDDFNKHYREHTYIPNPQPQNHEQNRIE